MAMTSICCGGSGEEGAENAEKAKLAMREMFGPQAIDSSIRSAITQCWMMLPEGKKNVETVEAEIRRIVERALSNLREDANAFGIGAAQSV